jgi:hypothetical protein
MFKRKRLTALWLKRARVSFLATRNHLWQAELTHRAVISRTRGPIVLIPDAWTSSDWHKHARHFAETNRNKTKNHTGQGCS